MRVRTAAGLLVLGAVGSEAVQPGPTQLEITVGENVHVSSGASFPHVEPHLVAVGADPPNFVAAAMTMPDPVSESTGRRTAARPSPSRWPSPRQ